MSESFVIEVLASNGEWVEVERIDKPKGCRWNGAFMRWQDLIASKVRTRFEDKP